MKFFNIVALGSAAFVLLSALPSTCGAALAVEKRAGASDAVSILNSATAQITPVKNELLSLYSSGDLSDLTFVHSQIVPKIKQINSIASSAATQISALKLSKRQVDASAVATALTTLVKEIVAALEPLVKFLSSVPLLGLLLGPLLTGLAATLNTIALGLGTLVGGVLELVHDLLASLLGAL